MKTTLSQVIEAHKLVSATIGTIFSDEGSFKQQVLALPVHTWNINDYTIERCHTALRYRLTLKHNDGRERDIYIDASEVYDWVDGLRILGE